MKISTSRPLVGIMHFVINLLKIGTCKLAMYILSVQKPSLISYTIVAAIYYSFRYLEIVLKQLSLRELLAA